MLLRAITFCRRAVGAPAREHLFAFLTRPSRAPAASTPASALARRFGARLAQSAAAVAACASFGIAHCDAATPAPAPVAPAIGTQPRQADAAPEGASSQPLPVAQPKKASLGAQIAALLLDSGVIMGLMYALRPILDLIHPLASAITLAAAPFVYDIYFYLWWRTPTPGETALGFRVVSREPGPLRFRQVMVRRLVHMAHTLPTNAHAFHASDRAQATVDVLRLAGLAVFPLVDARGDCLHDVLAATTTLQY
jgi:uncharacterized RDD family membrane protein YckC